MRAAFFRIFIHGSHSGALFVSGRVSRDWIGLHDSRKVKKSFDSGYEAMFWKNLRCPPDGLEEVSVFENFLNWIKVFQPIHNSVNGIENEMNSKLVLPRPETVAGH